MFAANVDLSTAMTIVNSLVIGFGVVFLTTGHERASGLRIDAAMRTSRCSRWSSESSPTSRR